MVTDPDEVVITRKRRKGIYVLPNLFTLAALFGGFYAIVMAMNGQFAQAATGGDGLLITAFTRPEISQFKQKVRIAGFLFV